MSVRPPSSRARRDATSRRGGGPPLWLVEGLDLLERRRTELLAVVGVVAVLALGFAVFAPGLLPPTPLVGAAIGLAALLLGLAAIVALDATDLAIRGPRHVAAAGGELVAILPVEATPEAAEPLARAVLDAKDADAPLLLGMSAVGRDVRATARWVDALGVALVRGGVSVLAIDLVSGRTERDGLLEVVRDGVRLGSAAEVEPGMRLARLGAGRDQSTAITALRELPERLPQDLDVLLVALPTAATREVVVSARALDHLVVVCERDRSVRVDLIAGLDALEAGGTTAQVVLLDDPNAARLGAANRARAVPAVAEPPADGAAPRGDTDDGPGETVEAAAASTGTASGDEAGASAMAARSDEQSGPDEPDSPDEPIRPDALEESDESDHSDEADDPDAPAGRDPRVLAGAAEAAAIALVEAEPARSGHPGADPDEAGDLTPGRGPQDATARPSPDLDPGELVVPTPRDELRRDTDTAPGAQLATEAAAGDHEPHDRDAPSATEDVAVEASTGDRPGDSTDELPKVRRPRPVASADDDDDDLLRTTARLAVLMERAEQDRSTRP